MATQLLATASIAADSSDLVVAVGTPVTVCLKGVISNSAEVVVKLKDDAGAYNIVGYMTSQNPAMMISAPGTYRFSRVAGGTCGVFSA